MKKILGLDIGTNSIGWAFIESNAYENPEHLNGRLIDLGSRIIPMDGVAMSKFESGNPESKAAGRRAARSARRLNQRYKLRRSRLIETLQILEWLPKNFPNERKETKIFKKLDKHNINKYLPYSESLLNEVRLFFGLANKKNAKGDNYQIPEDWVIYYLKTKALKQKVSLTELARILYHFNQRRGFKSSRKDQKSEEEIIEVKYSKFEKWVEIVTITNVSEQNKITEKGTEYTFYEIECKTTDFKFKAIKKRRHPLDWLNKEKELEITKKTTKSGEISFTVSEVDPKAWENRKDALSKDIDKTGLSISEYYLNNLKSDRNYKIKQRIVDRDRYQKEFEAIWKRQELEYKLEFSNQSKIDKIADSLYKYNVLKNKELKIKGLFHIFFNDIIYFQRGLKSQKGLLANCTYESKSYFNKNGEKVKVGVKVCNRSNPFFQEFRIWQTIHNLKIIQKEAVINGKIKLNIDVTDKYLNNNIKEKLFELFDKSKEISHYSILTMLGFEKKKVENGKKTFEFKLNYPDDKDFLGNETKSLFLKVFKKCDWIEAGKLILEDSSKFYQLWHIIYSLPEEKDIYSALSNKKYFDFPENVIKSFSKLPEFKNQYSSLSQRAIQNLLPLMRVGKYWKVENLEAKPKNTKGFNLKPSINLIERAKEISINSPNLSERVKKEIENRDFSVVEELSGLPTFLAAYLAYGRHSEREDDGKYNSIEDFRINEIIPYNSLRNPIVEKVVRETLKLVKDVWASKNLGRPDFIHVELGRELKNNNKEREKIAKQNSNNRVERERIANLLKELKFPDFNPDSPSDIDRFRIWKEQGGNKGIEEFEKLFKSGKADLITNAEIEKYRLWAEQGYISPYSGNPIKLSELFTSKYQVDHIIPKAKYYDDSFGNKVLVEAELNDLKSNRLAIQFIEDSANNKSVIGLDQYIKFVDCTFSGKKKKHLKLYEVPEGFIERQMNDTKYISRTIAQFLRPVAKGMENVDENGRKTIDEGLIYTTGSITSDLKNKWGLNKLWKELLKPRFERLEGIIGEQLIIPNDSKKGDYHFAKDYKRIDHRHHALDALVIACTSRTHIKYLNSLNSLSNNKKDIAQYNEWQKWKYLLNKQKQLENKENGMTEFDTPWGDFHSFYSEVFDRMEGIIVSHKPTSKLISKTINKYYRWVNEDGNWLKKAVKQSKPINDDKFWVAVRQSLFGQPLGKVLLPEFKKDIELSKIIKFQIDYNNKGKNWKSEDWRIAKTTFRKKIDEIILVNKGDEKSILTYLKLNPLLDENGNAVEKLDLLKFKKYASKRVAIDESFTLDKIAKMPFSEHKKNWLTNLLKDHLSQYDKNTKEAFKGEGLEQLFKKAPFPINKVTRIEGGDKIEINNKLLDGDSGVNQFFIIETTKELDKKTGEIKTVKKYSTPPFLECIERLAKGLPIHDENPESSYIVLSPGDLVYVPFENENANSINWQNRIKIASNIYIMKSSNDYSCYFLPVFVSNIIQKGEFESLGKSEKTIDGGQIIKSNCIKIKIDRLGNITKV